jgi:hypothetical protein
MNTQFVITVLANIAVIVLLVIYGLKLFADYHARGRWAKNVTSLFAGLGMIILAFALLITPQNADLLVTIAATGVAKVFLGISSGLLLSAIAAFGVITYLKPLRLWHERNIERDLKRDLPNIS